MNDEKILVIGSISMDLIVEVERGPKLGETVKGEKFFTLPGGKGANQAMAIAKLGGKCQFIGAVGDDYYGAELLTGLQKVGIDVSETRVVEQQQTGTAHITIEQKDNRIIAVPGANQCLGEEKIESVLCGEEVPELVVIQNEISLSIVEFIIERCAEKGIPVLYNPAPAILISQELLDKVTYLTPNESEFKQLFPNKNFIDVLKDKPNRWLVTLGDKGVAYHNGIDLVTVPSFPTKVVDTTGAGDAFNGAMANALVKKADFSTAINFGNLVASLSITKMGAQTGLPTIAEVKESPYYDEKWFIE